MRPVLQRLRLISWVLPAVVVVGLSACSGTSGDDVKAAGGSSTTSTAPGGSSTAPSTGSTATTTTPGRRGSTGSGKPVTLAFGGDVSFQNQTAAVAAHPGTVLSAIAPVLSGADLAMVNLETALGSGGTPQNKTFTYQVPAQAVDALRAAGVDAVTMANNHGKDYGPVGFQDTLRIKESTGFPILGIGADEDQAYSPLVKEVNGQRIGILAASDIFDDNLRAGWLATATQPGLASAEEDHQARLLQAVDATRKEVDTLVVYLHMGTEKQLCPNQRQKDLARVLTEHGVDIVIGSHPHRLQGMGYLGDKFVAYSMGNFVFKANSPDGAATGVLLVTATGRRIDGFEFKPAVIRNTIPYPLSGSAAQAALTTMDQRRACSGLTATAGAGTAG